MVAHPRFDDPRTGSKAPHFSFDAFLPSEIDRFLVVYDNVPMRRKTDKKKALQVLCHLEWAVFDFYYASFAHEGPPNEGAERYEFFKKKLLAELAEEAKRE